MAESRRRCLCTLWQEVSDGRSNISTPVLIYLSIHLAEKA